MRTNLRFVGDEFFLLSSYIPLLSEDLRRSMGAKLHSLSKLLAIVGALWLYPFNPVSREILCDLGFAKFKTWNNIRVFHYKYAFLHHHIQWQTGSIWHLMS